MKRIKYLLAILIAVLLCVASVTAVSAGSYDDVFKNLKFMSLGEYPEGTIPSKQYRSFAASPDGKFVFAGGLNGGIPTVGKFDGTTGKLSSTYQFAVESGAYIKGLAADDRGYVYCGIANKANDGAIYFSVIKSADLSQVSYLKIDITGKVGVNGTAISKQGSKYFLYLVTNYETDRIYCYDVTNAASPAIVTSFGTNGFVDIAAKLGVSEGNNIAVAADGTIYLAAKTASGSKGDTVLKIKSDGSAVLAKVAFAEAFGCTLYDDQYVISASYNAAKSAVEIYNASDLSIVASYPITDAANLTNAQIGGNKLYVCDQGYNSGDRILVSAAINFPAKTPVKTETPSSASTADNTVAATLIFVVISSAGIILYKEKTLNKTFNIN